MKDWLKLMEEVEKTPGNFPPYVLMPGHALRAIMKAQGRTEMPKWLSDGHCYEMTKDGIFILFAPDEDGIPTKRVNVNDVEGFGE